MTGSPSSVRPRSTRWSQSSVLAVVVDDLVCRPELVEQLVAEHVPYLLDRVLAVQSVGADQEDVLLLDSHAVKLLEDELDGYLPVAGLLFAAFDAVGEDDRHLAALLRQFGEGRHADRVAQASESLLLKPVLRDAWRIGDGDAGDEDVRVVRKLCAYCTLSVFEVQFHFFSSPSSC